MSASFAKTGPFVPNSSLQRKDWKSMENQETSPLDAYLLALPETAGSALYGMVDVLAATSVLWREFIGEDPGDQRIRPHIVSRTRKAFRCGNGIPVSPEASFHDIPTPGVLIIPEFWLAPDDDMADRYKDLKEWLNACYQAGSIIYSGCSASVLLAASGLLDGREATSHWGYEDLFRKSFPSVRFNPAPNIVLSDPQGRIVTAGGTTSWHDLALHIISRHCSPGEALRIAKVYLLKWHSEGQLPFASLVRRQPHADSIVRQAETWLADHFREPHPVASVVEECGIPERTLKRRFKTATGSSLITHVQNLRIEEAKRLLEGEGIPTDEIAAQVGYENPAFFRRVFKRSTGLTPSHYRRMFRPMSNWCGESAPE